MQEHKNRKKEVYLWVLKDENMLVPIKNLSVILIFCRNLYQFPRIFEVHELNLICNTFLVCHKTGKQIYELKRDNLLSNSVFFRDLQRYFWHFFFGKKFFTLRTHFFGQGKFTKYNAFFCCLWAMLAKIVGLKLWINIFVAIYKKTRAQKTGH